MGAGGRAGHWAQACVAGVRTGAQGVLALGVGAGARAAGGRGAQALGRAELWRARGRTKGRAGARLGARCARGTAGRQHGRSLCAQAGLAGPGWGFVHPAWFSASFF